MQLEINEFAEIISGFTFRTSIEPTVNGRYFVLQAKNLNSSEITHESELIQIDDAPARNNSFLKESDVVIMSKGFSHSFKASIFKLQNENVIASSSVFIIRIVNENVDPHYLKTYLNSPQGQSSLVQASIGSNIKALPRSALEKVKVPVLPIHMQKTIVAAQNNLDKQELLLYKKLQVYRTIINQSFNDLIN